MSQYYPSAEISKGENQALLAPQQHPSTMVVKGTPVYGNNVRQSAYTENLYGNDARQSALVSQRHSAPTVDQYGNPIQSTAFETKCEPTCDADCFKWWCIPFLMMNEFSEKANITDRCAYTTSFVLSFYVSIIGFVVNAVICNFLPPAGQGIVFLIFVASSIAFSILLAKSVNLLKFSCPCCLCITFATCTGCCYRAQLVKHIEKNAALVQKPIRVEHP